MIYSVFGMITAILWVAPAAPPVSGPAVTAVFPPSHHVSASVDTDIVVTFDGPIRAETFDETTFYVFGRWSGPARGVFLFEEDNTRVRFVSDSPFMAGEWVTVSLSRGIEGVDGESIAGGYAWNFWTRAAPAGFDFEMDDDLSARMPGEGLVRSYGAYAGDLDRDGYSDLLIPNEDANDLRVFMNDGAGGYGGFVVYPIPGGDLPSTNEGADFNLDGFIDIAVGNSRGATVSVWKGDGSGGIIHVENAPADTQVRGLCVLDMNADGYFDIVTANRFAGENQGNVSLLLNDGSGRFTAASTLETGAGGETACSAADANNDGILDLFVGAYSSNEIVLLIGNGSGGFSVSDRKAVGKNVWMTAAGDVNGDGFADVLSVDAGASTMSVVLGDGLGGLGDAQTYQTGAFPLAIDLGDLDGDADLDVIVSNFSSAEYDVFENTGDGAFERRLKLPAITAASCAVLHDRDNDGDLDITGIDEIADRIFLFENTALGTAVEPLPTPQDNRLLDNYPDPFYEYTDIVFRSADTAVIKVTIYTVLGQPVRRLSLQSVATGEQRIRWDGRNNAGQPVSPGIYIYTLETTAGVVKATMVRL